MKYSFTVLVYQQWFHVGVSPSFSLPNQNGALSAWKKYIYLLYAAVFKPYSQPFFHLRVKDKHISTKNRADGKSLVSHAELTEFDPATLTTNSLY